MANPQPTPFVQFSKELFDALLLSGMPATHKEIVLAVIRRTYGDHGQKSAAISQTLLQRMTGRSRNGIRRSLDELLAQGVIVQEKPAGFSAPAVLALNKDYEKWGRWSVERATVVAQAQDLSQDNDDGGGQGHSGCPGQGHYGVPGQGHSGGPMEDSRTVEQETEVAAPPSGSLKVVEPGPPSEPSAPLGASSNGWVGRWVDACKAAGQPEPSKSAKAAFGRNVKTIPDLDADVMHDAIRLMVERGKHGGVIAYVYDDARRIAEQETFRVQTGGGRRVR